MTLDRHHLASPGHSIYCASKHAVAALSKSASTEVAKDNIRVNCVNPGML